MTDLRAIARALGGEVGGGQVLAPGPSHSRKDRSLSVRSSPTSPSGVIVHSFAGDDWRLCLHYVCERLGLQCATGPRGRSDDRRQAPEPRVGAGALAAAPADCWVNC